MPLPTPNLNESASAWLARCMADPTMVAEYPDAESRSQACGIIRQRAVQADGAAGGMPETGQGNTGVTNNPSSAAYRVGGTPVHEFRLVGFGPVAVDRPAKGGPFSFTRAQAEQLVAWFNKLGRRLAIDYDHQSIPDLNTRPDGLAPAAGWIGRLEIRPDGLWAADVEWTPQAAAMLASGQYAYFSPVIYWRDREQQIPAGLGPVALTNDPAMAGVPALAASRLKATAFSSQHSEVSRKTDQRSVPQLVPKSVTQGSNFPDRAVERISAATSRGNTGGPRMDLILKALGLQSGATEEEVVAAITALQQQAGGLATVAKELELGEVADAPALVAAVKQRLAPADSGPQVELLKRVAELEKANRDLEFEQLVASGAGKGKVTPAMLPTMRDLFHKDRDAALRLIGDLPVIARETTVFAKDQPVGQADGNDEEAWKAAFAKDHALRHEFGDVDTYVAFRRAESSGLARRLTAKQAGA